MVMKGENVGIFIIAEAGVNHNGSIETAKQLIDVAQESGADCVKFQTFVAENLVSKGAAMAQYQLENVKKRQSQYAMLKELELSFSEFLEIKRYCDYKGIVFLSTPFDLASIDFLDNLDMPYWKIPSGEITNLPYLEKIAATKKPVILSTGMSDDYEVGSAISALKNGGSGHITLMHCTTEYPAPYNEVNLRAMVTMMEMFGLPTGYSDHTVGWAVPVAAAALGAVMIEKHFTLDKNMPGPDHKASLNPDELRRMITEIRNVEHAMGSGIKSPSKGEMKNIGVVRKSIVAKKRIREGEMYTEDNITVKRPGTGISPMRWHELLGKAALRDFEEDELIEI